MTRTDRCPHGLNLLDCKACDADMEVRLARFDGRRKPTMEEALEDFRDSCRAFVKSVATEFEKLAPRVRAAIASLNPSVHDQEGGA